MATSLKLNKVTTLPTSLDSDAVYFEKGGGDTYSDLIVTDNVGNGYVVINDQRITELITAATNTEIELVSDIAARDALTLSQNSLVLVSDASGDNTVDSGTAMYFFDNTNSVFVKVTEFESLDVTIQWADIVNGPTSTPAQIDQAVVDTATNKTKLDAITDIGSGQIITASERSAIGTNTNNISTNATAISTNASNITANAANINTLQTDSHTHTNKLEIDKIGEDNSGCLLYDGVSPTYWATAGW